MPLPDWRAFGSTRASLVVRGAVNDLRESALPNGEPVWTAVYPGTAPAARASADLVEASFLAREGLRNLAPGHPVLIRLVYQDGPPAQYSLTYDSNDARVFATGRPAGAGKPLAPVQLTGTGKWMVAQWTVTDARFAGHLDGADLRLAGNRPALVSAGLFLETAYPVPAEAQPNAGVPQGQVIKFVLDQSRIFPGTTREIAVYVPAQYDGRTPACVWVDQDGMLWNDAPVLDALIAQQQVPVMVSIGIPPGKIVYPAGNDRRGAEAAPWSNRSFEYDTLSGDYARFVTEEVFPAVERLKTKDGRALFLSRQAADCGISGASSGGICAFTAAWENPGAFSRVFSGIGSFDNIRNGDRYPGLIRKTEPKPIRVFLQDGASDLNWFAGDWSLANQRMDRALTWAGYEHQAVWGDGSHNGMQPIAVFADALRFLWKGWPQPVGGGVTFNRVLQDFLVEHEGWKPVWTGPGAPAGLAASAHGDVIFGDPGSRSLRQVAPDGAVSLFASDAAGAGPMIFGSDDRLYRAEPGARRIVAYGRQGAMTVFATGIEAAGIAALDQGRLYVNEPAAGGAPSKIWLFHADGSRLLVDSGAAPAGSLGVDAQQHYLFAAGGESWIYRLQIQADGTLRDKTRMSAPEIDAVSGTAGVRGLLGLDANLIAATDLGLQFCSIHSGDVNGAVMAIVPAPERGAAAVVFGGSGFDTLYVISGHGIYTRRTRQRGPAPLNP